MAYSAVVILGYSSSRYEILPVLSNLMTQLVLYAIAKLQLGTKFQTLYCSTKSPPHMLAWKIPVKSTLSNLLYDF